MKFKAASTPPAPPAKLWYWVQNVARAAIELPLADQVRPTHSASYVLRFHVQQGLPESHGLDRHKVRWQAANPTPSGSFSPLLAGLPNTRRNCFTSSTSFKLRARESGYSRRASAATARIWLRRLGDQVGPAWHPKSLRRREVWLRYCRGRVTQRHLRGTLCVSDSFGSVLKSLMEIFEHIQTECKYKGISQSIMDTAIFFKKKVSEATHTKGKRQGKTIIMRCVNRKSIKAAPCTFPAVQSDFQRKFECVVLFSERSSILLSSCKRSCPWNSLRISLPLCRGGKTAPSQWCRQGYRGVVPDRSFDAAALATLAECKGAFLCCQTPGFWPSPPCYQTLVVVVGHSLPQSLPLVLPKRTLCASAQSPRLHESISCNRGLTWHHSLLFVDEPSRWLFHPLDRRCGRVWDFQPDALQEWQLPRPHSEKWGTTLLPQ